MNSAPHIKGWCPTAWRPMLSGDGYLVRLHFSCGIASSQRARAIACLAERFGNGLIDLTRRGNLQIRGVTEDQIVELQAALVAEDLISNGPAGGEMANVIASPLAGRDRDAPLDIRPLVRELELRFATDPRLHELPAKFCVTIDDGGRLPLHDLAADISFEACERNSGFHFAVGIGGNSIGFADTEQVPDTAVTLAATFNSLRLRHPKIVRRLHELIAEIGLAAITASSPTLGQACTDAAARRRVMAGPGQRDREAVGLVADDVFGAAVPFGSLSSNQLAFLSDLADHHAEGELRLTPWRAILIPAIASGAIERVKAECARAGLITVPCDPRRRIEACTGAPGCASASVSTRDVAAVLAPLLRPEDTLHVSGCAKSCASSSAASMTLVGRGGRFDLVRDGKPGDTPARFGLSAEEARSALGRIAAEDLAHVERLAYIRDGVAIYARSFAIIRAEADLARFSPEEERVAVRIIHASGMTEIAPDMIFLPGVVAVARDALHRGAPILCDSKMVANGITRARLPANNEVICTLDDARVPGLASAIANTRTAAAMELWRDRLGGAVVAVGNAPTALFRLLEMLDGGAPKPAAIIGMPVGFVGAAESKEALIADGRVPFITIRGRKGGSAMTVAAVNALASERE